MNLHPPAACERSCDWTNVGEDERRLSLLAAGLLIGLGAANRGWIGLGLAACGAGLIFRGATGHCYTYEALGVSTVPPEDHP
ncbi:MAG: DUF2892 domain-containing protein [Planctomycetaceae bacterium]